MAKVVFFPKDYTCGYIYIYLRGPRGLRKLPDAQVYCTQV